MFAPKIKEGKIAFFYKRKRENWLTSMIVCNILFEMLCVIIIVSLVIAQLVGSSNVVVWSFCYLRCIIFCYFKLHVFKSSISALSACLSFQRWNAVRVSTTSYKIIWYSTYEVCNNARVSRKSRLRFVSQHLTSRCIRYRSRQSVTPTWSSAVCRDWTKVDTSSRSATWRSSCSTKCLASRYDIVPNRNLCYVLEYTRDHVLQFEVDNTGKWYGIHTGLCTVLQFEVDNIGVMEYTRDLVLQV